jgi:hypothetical protein
MPAIQADVAQPVEHFTRNEGVRGSNPRVGFYEALTRLARDGLFPVVNASAVSAESRSAAASSSRLPTGVAQ